MRTRELLFHFLAVSLILGHVGRVCAIETGPGSQTTKILGLPASSSPVSGPARLELYNGQWSATTQNHISASAGFAGADPSVKIGAALASPLCANGCIVEDGLATGSAANYVHDSMPIVIGANQHLILHAHHYWGGVTLHAPAIQLNGVGASVSCEQPPAFVDGSAIASAWQGSCGIDLEGALGGQSAIRIGSTGTLVKWLTIRGDRNMGAVIDAAPATTVEYSQVIGNVIRGTYSTNYTSGFGVDITVVGRPGVTDQVIVADNEIFWTSGGIRFNPSNSGFKMTMRDNTYMLGYGPAFVVGPGYTFDARLDGNSCAFIQASSANENIWDIDDADAFLAINNHDECHDVSAAGGVREIHVTAQNSGALINNTFNGNTDDVVAAHDSAYNIYIESARNIVVQGNLLKNAHVSGIHFGPSVTGITHSGNYYERGHGPSGSYTDGSIAAVYGTNSTEANAGTGSPTGWADTCVACTGTPMVANKYYLVGKYLQSPVSFSQMCFNVTAADGVNHSDACLYDAKGALIADLGPQHMSKGGDVCLTPVQPTPITLPPGLYFYGFTSDGNALHVTAGSAGNQMAYSRNYGYGASSNGRCATSIAPPPKGPTGAGMEFGLF